MSKKKREAGRAERTRGVEEKKEKGTFLSSSWESNESRVKDNGGGG
jgi:hypothetical protein